MHLTILYTNDIHGRLDQMGRLATLMQWERSRTPEDGHFLLLDAGDSSERTVWESDVTKGRANFVLLEAMAYQATTVGNSEALQWGRNALARLVASVDMPVLAGNLFQIGSEDLAVPGLRSHVWLTAGSLKIAVLGLTAPIPGGYERFGLAVGDPVRIARRLIREVRAEGADLVILLSHLGFVRDEERLDPEYVSDYQLASLAPGLDVIVGGHTHTILESPVQVGPTWIVQAGAYGQYLGRLDVEVAEGLTTEDEPSEVTHANLSEARSSSRMRTGSRAYLPGSIVAVEGHLIPAPKEVPPESTVEAVLELVREEAGRVLDRVIGQAAEPLPAAFDRSSAMTDLVADALREICEVDLAVYFSGFVGRGLDSGPIRRRDLYQAVPGSSHVTAATVRGDQVWRMLEMMLDPSLTAQPTEILRRQRPLGLPAVSSGVEVVYDPFAPTGQRVEAIRLHGQRLLPEQTVRLASTYYTLNDMGDIPGYGFVLLTPRQTLRLVRIEDVLWEILADWVKAHSPLRAPAGGARLAPRVPTA